MDQWTVPESIGQNLSEQMQQHKRFNPNMCWSIMVTFILDNVKGIKETVMDYILYPIYLADWKINANARGVQLAHYNEIREASSCPSDIGETKESCVRKTAKSSSCSSRTTLHADRIATL